MKPVIALVGRPNVGKSTLFNRLTKTRSALVADFAGLTRDRQYGAGRTGPCAYWVVDTGGLLGAQEQDVMKAVSSQVAKALEEANIILFLVDAREGLTSDDIEIAQSLRRQNKSIYLVVNKTDGTNEASLLSEFSSLGMQPVFFISAVHGRGVSDMIETLLEPFVEEGMEAEDEQSSSVEGIKIAVVGRPNVGKSTLVNRMLGEERVLVYDAPGTTRDSIYIPFTRHDKPYVLIDTAGVRRRARVHETVEKFSIVKTLEAIDNAHVVLLLIDAREPFVEQDLHLIGLVLQSGRAMVVVVNKWDGLSDEQKQQVREQLEFRLRFARFVKVHTISALHGTGVGGLFESVESAYVSATTSSSTPELNKILLKATTQHQPPIVKGRRIKLRYAHMGGLNPPRLVIHGTQTEQVPDAYRRYLAQFFRTELKLEGVPLTVEFKSGSNPYAHKRNQLTERQIKKRKRLMKFVKKR